jgi:SanA protein
MPAKPFKYTSWVRILFRLIAGIVLAGILILGAINGYVLGYAAPYIQAEITSESSGRPVVILGAGLRPGGKPSLMLQDRLETGYRVYRIGAPKILLSGDHGQKYYDEVNVMRKYLQNKGVNAQDIFLDHAGFDTYASMYRTRDVFRTDRITIVTQQFHLARAVYIARRLGIDAVGIPADQHAYQTLHRSQIREILARVKAFIEVEITQPKPRYLGETFPLEGDGRVTWD